MNTACTGSRSGRSRTERWKRNISNQTFVNYNKTNKIKRTRRQAPTYNSFLLPQSMRPASYDFACVMSTQLQKETKVQ